MGVKNMDNVEVTVFYRKEKCRDMNGVEREKIVFDRLARADFDDGEQMFTTVQILFPEMPGDNEDGKTIIYLESRESRDDGTGSQPTGLPSGNL